MPAADRPRAGGASRSPVPDLGALRPVLGEARARGFLGSLPLERQLDHARAMCAALEQALRAAAPAAGGAGADPPAWSIADLGSGGGVPGLVVAVRFGGARVTLVESQARRAGFLADAAAQLAPGRVVVLHDRAERVGRSPTHRGTYDAVTARSFARPAVTAECAAPLLRVGGVLVVSEPPAEQEEDAGAGRSRAGAGAPTARWPAGELAGLGLAPLARPRGPYRFQVLRQVEACPERFPRRVGVPQKRPLF